MCDGNLLGFGCDPSTKPKKSQTCGDWVAGRWGPCVNEVQFRTVDCPFEVCDPTKKLETFEMCKPDVPPTSAWDPQKNLADFIKAVYISSWYVQPTKEGWRKVFEDLINAGYNVLILAFLTDKPGTDAPWTNLSPPDKRELVDFLHSKSVVWLVSIGGSSVIGTGPSKCDFSWIKNVGQHCFDNLYDGADIDLEQVTRKIDNGECNKDLVAIAQAIRQTYTTNGKNCVITSAPQSPYFNASSPWAFDYIEIEKIDNKAFDFYNIQFYNNGLSNTKELTIGSLDVRNINDSDKVTAYNIYQSKIPKSKIVIGKTGIDCEGTENTPSQDYYIPGQVLQKMVKDAGFRGVMYWTYLGKCNPEATNWLNSPS
jgi:chitinase